MKKVAVMNDLSGFGKCSLTAAIPVLSVMGVQCCPLPSGVLTNQTGYAHYYCTDLSDMLPSFIDAWKKNNAHFDGIYSGFMINSEQINSFHAFLDEFMVDDTFLIVDPVMGDDGKTYSIFSNELLNSMKKLSRRADMITPNYMEACLLADYDINKAFEKCDRENLLSIATEVGQKLMKNADKKQDIVITGIKCLDDEVPHIYNLAVTEDGVYENKSEFFDKSFSGTGDLFASVMCGCRLNGLSITDSMNLAGKFIYHSIEDTVKEGTPSEDGVNFEKYLIELIEGINLYRK